MPVLQRVALVVMGGILCACGRTDLPTDTGIPADDASPPPAPAAATLISDHAGTGGSPVEQGVLELSVWLSDNSPMTGVAAWVDNVPALPQRYGLPPTRREHFVLAIPAEGRRTLNVRAYDQGGRLHTREEQFLVTFPTVEYSVARLPDLGLGASADWIHPDGTVAGSVTRSDGRRRPAVWKNRDLTVLDVTDSAHGRALRTNEAGDVLLQYDGPGIPPGESVRVLRADGSVAVLTSGTRCCVAAIELTETRKALAATTSTMEVTSTGPVSYMFDIPSMTRTDSSANFTTHMNRHGLTAGVVAGGYFNVGRYVVTNFPLQRPEEPRPALWTCDAFERWSHEWPHGLDDNGNLLTIHCGVPILYTAPGPGSWLSRYFLPSRYMSLSRTGEMIAAVHGDRDLYVWRGGSARSHRVAWEGAGWRVASLGGVAPDGRIVVTAEPVAGGGHAALLLSPR